MTRRPLSRLARRLIEKYPQAWRERYEEEMLALLDESPAGFTDVAELARGLVVEQVRAMVTSTDRPARTLSHVGRLKVMFAIVFSLAAIGVGSLMRQWPPSPAVSEAVVWVYVLTLLSVVGIRTVMWLHRRRSREVGGPLFPASAAGIALSAAFVIIVLFEWAHAEPPHADGTEGGVLSRFNAFYLYSLVGAWLASDLWPSQRLLEALMHLEACEQYVAGARSWVAGCHEMIALGVPSPLAEAEAQVEHWTRERDLVRAKVEQQGYRARFTT